MRFREEINVYWIGWIQLSISGTIRVISAHQATRKSTQQDPHQNQDQYQYQTMSTQYIGSGFGYVIW